MGVQEPSRDEHRALSRYRGAEQRDFITAQAPEQAAQVAGLDGEGPPADLGGSPAAVAEPLAEPAQGERDDVEHLKGSSHGVERRRRSGEIGDVGVQHAGTETRGQVSHKAGARYAALGVEEDGPWLDGRGGGFGVAGGQFVAARKQHSAAEAGMRTAAEPECRFAKGASELDEFDLGAGRLVRVCDARRCLDDTGSGGAGDFEAKVERRLERRGVAGAACTLAAGRVEEDGRARELQGRAKGISAEDARVRDVGGGEERGHRVGIEAHGSRDLGGDGAKVAPGRAGKVGHRERQAGEPQGATRGDKRVGHHFEPCGGEKQTEVGTEPLAGAAA